MRRRSFPILVLLAVLTTASWWVAALVPKGTDVVFESGFENRPPTANAGVDQAVQVNQPVTLSGSGIDPEGQPLTFAWTVASQPSGSNIALLNPTLSNPNFTPAVEGSYVLRLVVSDGQLASAPDLVTVTASVGPPVPVANAGPAQVVDRGVLVQLDGSASFDPLNRPLIFAWVVAEQPLGSAVVLQSPTTATPTFTPAIAGLYRLRLTVRAGNVDSQPTIVEISAVPPAPTTVAPALPQTSVTSTALATSFLYSGPNPIQTGVAPGAISMLRGAALNGRVINRNSAGIPGVTVSVLGRPEFGQTVTRADGRFDLAVNGAEQVVLEFTREGLLSAQRRVSAGWQGQRVLDRIVMIPPDPIGNRMPLGRMSESMLAKATTTRDSDGTRRASLYVPAGADAMFEMADGRRMAMTSAATLRITEYTIGDLGPNTMPGDLPSTTSYTYAADISIDQAVPLEAVRVSFSQPLAFYVDNFLNFDTGEVVPLGYYDRATAEWVPAPNGRVISVLAINGGLASLDVTGFGQPATPAELVALGINSAELAQIASQYAAGQRFWRSRIPFLQARGGAASTPWDCNWPRVPPPDARPPRTRPTRPSPTPKGVPAEGEDECRPGSVIQCQRQVMMKSLPVVGTPLSLHYSTERVPGWRGSASATIPLSDASLPASALRIDLDVQVAGQRIVQSFGTAPNQNFGFNWNRLDGFGRSVNGAQEVVARVGYVYPAVYASPGQFAQAFSTLSGVPISGDRARENITLWQEHRFPLGAPVASTVFGLGGFSLTPHHFYDPVRRTLFQGDGSIREPDAQRVDSAVRTFAGAGTVGFGGDGGAAVAAQFNGPRGLEVGSDGSVFVADMNNRRVRRIDPSGTISTVAGSGVEGFEGDGGPATAARLSQPADVAVDREGNLYIADPGNHRIRRVRRDGIIETVAGTGTAGFAGDGGLATSAQLNWPWGVAIGPFGELYIADTSNERVRKIGADGVITTVAGNGQTGVGFGSPNGDGGPAIDAQLTSPFGIDVSADGELFIADTLNYRIRRVDASGEITSVAGTGLRGDGDPESLGEGGPATSASLAFPRSVTVMPDGKLLIVDNEARRVRVVTKDGIILTLIGGGPETTQGIPGLAFRLGSAIIAAIMPDGRIAVSDALNMRVHVLANLLPQFEIGDVTIPSPDGSELYRFAANGRHLDTRDTLTGAIRWQFTYDAVGRLLSLRDGDNNVTTIERDGAGTPTAIVSPDNLRTRLTLTAGLLTEVRNPNNERVGMEYVTGGLISRFTDERDGVSTYNYNAEGRLLASQDPAMGGQTLTRAETSAGASVVVQSVMGERQPAQYLLEIQSDGTQLRRTTFPEGTRTEVRVPRDGSRGTTQPDSTTITDRTAPDPRFGMEAGYTASSQTATGGRTLSTTLGRTATLASATDPLSLVSLVEQQSINGRPSQRSYAAATRTWTSRSAANRTITTVIDAQSRPLRLQATGLAQVEMVYDGRGRISSTSTGSGVDQRDTTNAYGTNGFLASITDPLARSVSYVRDPVGRVLEATRPDTLKTEFTYDAKGNLATLKPAGRPAHRFSYTPVHLMATYEPPPVAGSGTTNTVYTYNRDRQLTEIMRPDGEDVDYTYDNAGRLATQVINRGSYTTSYSPTSGKLIGLNAPGGFNLAYTFTGALLAQQQWSGPLTGGVGFTYDNDFRIATISVNGANALSMTYDNDSLLTGAGALTLRYNTGNGLFEGSTIGTVIDAYAYNTFGEPRTYTVTQASNPIYAETYTRDKLGRITRKVETIAGVTRTLDYDYDLLGRLQEVKIDNTVAASYTYDPNGNRLTRVTSVQTTTHTYDDQDRLLTAGDTTYTYTAAGELRTITTGGNVTTLTHDELGNLLSVALPSGNTVSYGIDGQNRRVRKLVNGTPVQGFLYQDQLKIIAELDGANAVVSRFVYGDKLHVPAYMIKGGQTFRYVTDQVGSVRMLVNISTGAIAQRIDYDEFGNVTNDTQPGFQPFGFAGGLWDRETGLVRFGARNYDPRIGRWITKDPIGFFGADTNLYAYVAGDPINYVDPAGEWLIPVAIGAGIGALTGAISAMRDPCKKAKWQNVALGALGGAIGGAFGAVAPVTGTAIRAAIVGGGAAFAGNSLGQFAQNGGVQGYSASQAVVQGAIGAVAAGFGSAIGISAALSLAAQRSGWTAAEAAARGAGVGGTAGLGLSTGVNGVLPPSLGGFGGAGSGPCPCE